MRIPAKLAGVTVVCAVSAAHAGVPVDIVIRPRPQSETDTCQVYGLALAAASVPGTNMLAGNAKELRQAERELQAVRDAIAQTSREKYSHTVWKQALEKVSGGALTAEIRYVPNVEAFYAEVARLTGITNASSVGPVISGVLAKNIVLTSVKKVGKQKYSTGHIVGILGIDSINQSPQPLALLNAAVKLDKNVERIACELDEKVGDLKYQAAASIEKSYELTRFDGLGYLVLTVTRTQSR